ncbi:MAG: hypothetical protein H8D84_01190 [Proteobacteria bacterium]|nr:hypothetical protein [Pseudomonadota bacterium]
MHIRKLSEIKARIENCSNEEINAVVSMIKTQRQILAMNAGSQFTVGQKVTFSNMTGHIEKIARTRAIVQVVNGPRYRVQMATMRAA